MYQALLASGDLKAATKMLNKIPKDDPHVRCVIKACKTTYIQPTSLKGKNKKKRIEKGEEMRWIPIKYEKKKRNDKKKVDEVDI